MNQKPTISIELQELGEGYVQYQSVTAEISIDGDNYLLDSRLLDSEDEQADLDIIHGFTGVWEGKAETENLDFYIDDEIYELERELQDFVDNQKDHSGVTDRHGNERIREEE